MGRRYQHTADVIVVGGGCAGCMAAIAAAESGARVMVVEQARAIRSGDAGAGNDHLGAYLEEGPEWDTKEAFLDWYHNLSQALIPREVVGETVVDRVPEVVRRLERYGLKLRGEDGKYLRTSAFNQKGSYWINFDGYDLKPKLYAAAKAAGATFKEKVMVTSLLTREGRAVGCVGFGVRTGHFHVFKGKEVVLATGPAMRIWMNRTGFRFNTWHGPYNGAAALALAFEAGAELANVELATNNAIPKGFETPGYNGLLGMGGHLVNARGERFVQNYHPKGEKGPKWITCYAIWNEVREGRGPCYWDVRHLSPEALDHLCSHLLPVDKLTYMEFLRQKGVDLRKDLVEADISTLGLTGVTGKPHGIVVDTRCRTRVPGLFAAGVCALGAYALIGALTQGLTAGYASAEDARELERRGEPDPARVDALQGWTFAPLWRKEGIPYQEWDDRRAAIMSEHVGIGRTEEGLRKAEALLREMAGEADRLLADNLHELMRAIEAQHMLVVSRCIAKAALERKETRWGHGHLRLDHPTMDDPRWHGCVHIWKEGDEVAWRFVPAERIPEEAMLRRKAAVGRGSAA